MADPISNVAGAVNAYARTVQNATKPGIAARDTGQEDEFADLVKGAIREAVAIGKESERQSLSAVKDQADLSEVVTAVAEAELTLQTVVTVRDKVIEAYKEIIKMPI
jgi:flagellar hook-basal body complex protein FliE